MNSEDLFITADVACSMCGMMGCNGMCGGLGNAIMACVLCDAIGCIGNCRGNALGPKSIDSNPSAMTCSMCNMTRCAGNCR